MRSMITALAVCLCLGLPISSWQVEASMFDDMSRELQLTAQQQLSVKRIFDAEAKKLLELKESSLDASAKKKQFRLIQQQTLDRLEGILTIEQQQKYAHFQSKQKEKVRAKKQVVKQQVSTTGWVADE